MCICTVSKIKLLNERLTNAQGVMVIHVPIFPGG